MTRRKELESALAKAEANLQRAVTLLATPGVDQSAAGDELAKARANCRLARAAINELDNTEK